MMQSHQAAGRVARRVPVQVVAPVARPVAQMVRVQVARPVRDPLDRVVRAPLGRVVQVAGQSRRSARNKRHAPILRATVLPIRARCSASPRIKRGLTRKWQDRHMTITTARIP